MNIKKLNEELLKITEKITKVDEGEPGSYGKHYQIDAKEDILPTLEVLEDMDSFGFASLENILGDNDYAEYTVRRDGDKYAIIVDSDNFDRTEISDITKDEVIEYFMKMIIQDTDVSIVEVGKRA